MSRTLLLFLSLAAVPAAAAPKKAAPKPAPRAPAKKAAAPAPKAPAAPALPALAKDAVKLTVEPGGIALDGPRAVQRLVVTAHLKDGATLDVSDHAAFSLAHPRLAKIEKGVLLPLADGETTLTARLGKLTADPVAVTVAGATAPRTVEFVNDVMPILAKAGCNSTACHGSPAGKGGLKLSLFGYEPELDFAALTQAGKNRLDLKAPERSLLLQKATLAVPHAGGQRFKPTSREYYALLFWLKEGAPGIGEFEARVRSIEVLPASPWLPTPTAQQRLAVTAHMTDGSTRDVTEKALFSSNDDAIAAVDEAGHVRAQRPGETAVMVRYLGQVGVSRIAVLPDWKLPAQTLAKANYVDEAVQAKLARLRVAPSDLCSDEEFIRRVSLDVRGIIPSVEEVREFLADRSAGKRAKLIDAYLESPEHVDLWTMKWNDTLRNNPRLARLGTQSYAKWIRDKIAANTPYDQFVKEILTAEGRNTEQKLDPDNLPRQLQGRPGVERLVERLNAQEPNPAANYFVISRDPLDTTSATSQIFLGVRIECARCHNHPFEKWTQTDYYGLAAFMTGVTVQGNNQTPVVVSVNPRPRDLRHPKDNVIVEPKTLDNTEIKLARGEDRRAPLVNWMVAPENPWFARTLVNRLWGHYFGRGIVEPIDDIRVTNPASNPELWDALARDFTTRKFDVKAVHRAILNSRTYQSSAKANQWNKSDTTNFARYYPKRMMAEQLYDSISQATNVFLNTPAGFPGRGQPRRPAQQPLLQGLNRLGGAPQGDVARVMQLSALVPGQGGGRGPGGVISFLNTFGKPRREAVCECERTSDGNIGQALALLNGDTVNGKIVHPRGRLQELLRAGKPDAEVVEELYLATLSRRPNSTEMNDAATLLRSSSSKSEGFEDLLWGLLNSREFLFVH